MKTILILIAFSFALCSPSSLATLKIPEPEDVVSQDGTRTILGTLIDASNKTVTIMTRKGKCYSFSIAGAQQHFKNGMKIGKKVVISYTGELKSLDTSGVKVIKVGDYSDWHK